MTPEHFVTWLDGFMQGMGYSPFSAAQQYVIRAKLTSVRPEDNATAPALFKPAQVGPNYPPNVPRESWHEHPPGTLPRSPYVPVPTSPIVTSLVDRNYPGELPNPDLYDTR